jgi:tRNA(Ile)-lysidine synthetase-like protein
LIGEFAEQAVQRDVLVFENHEFILDIPKFLGYFISIQKELLMFAIRSLRPVTPFVNFHEIDRCMTLARAKSGRIELANRLEIVRASDRMYIFRKLPAGEVCRILVLNRWNSIPEMHGRIRILRVDRQKKIVFRKAPDLEYIDTACAGEKFIIRSWRAGDRFTPLGMKAQKKLHDFFIDAKVPRHRRPLIPILEVNGKIAWVVGMRISDHVRLKPTTKQIVQLQWSDDRPERGSQMNERRG